MGAKVKRLSILSFLCILLNSAQIGHLNFDSHSEVLAASLGIESTSSLNHQPAESEQALDSRTIQALPQYGGVVRQNALVYGLDWRLILAVMKNESNFNKRAVSRRGAYGLMQVMPATGIEVAGKLGLDNLLHPQRNIRGGIFYLAKLYNLFEGAPETDRLKLALGAYNAGPSRIYDAQELAAYLGDDPHSWQSIEKALPLLSKRFYTLHQSVWDGGKPRSGYFGKSRQTVIYVQRVLESYGQYKSILD